MGAFFVFLLQEGALGDEWIRVVHISMALVGVLSCEVVVWFVCSRRGFSSKKPGAKLKYLLKLSFFIRSIRLIQLPIGVVASDPTTCGGRQSAYGVA